MTGDEMAATAIGRGARGSRVRQIADALDLRIRRQREWRRVRTHLMTAESELRRGRTDLPPELLRARAQNLERLHAYWVAGRFPQNIDVPARTPHLRDRFGTSCAVAHLVEADGGKDIVDRLASTDNLVLLSTVTGGPLLEWLSTSGLSLEDAARIQPGYDPMPPSPPPNPPPTAGFPIVDVGSGVGFPSVGVPIPDLPMAGPPTMVGPTIPYTPHLPPPATPPSLPHLPGTTTVVPDNGLLLAIYVGLLAVVLVWAYLVAHGALDWRCLRARAVHGFRARIGRRVQA